MKTIKDISIQVGVSKTSIYNLIKKNNIETFRRDGKSYIDEKSENLIIAYYFAEQQETLDDIISDVKQTTEENVESKFQAKKEIESADIIRILENQLNEKDKTIQALLNVLSYEKNYQTAKLLADNNKNFMGEQPEPIMPELPPKKSFFERLFKL